MTAAECLVSLKRVMRCLDEEVVPMATIHEQTFVVVSARLQSVIDLVEETEKTGT